VPKGAVSESEEDPGVGVRRDRRKLRGRKQRILDSDASEAEINSDIDDSEEEEEEEAVSSDSDVVRKKPKRKKAASSSSSDDSNSEESEGPRKRRRIRKQSDSDGKLLNYST
jgi:hypothetical protein